jgi:hypothetical protein
MEPEDSANRYWEGRWRTERAENERLRAALKSAPRPEPSVDWIKPYVDWYFGGRREALKPSAVEQSKEG